MRKGDNRNQMTGIYYGQGVTGAFGKSNDTLVFH